MFEEIPLSLVALALLAAGASGFVWLEVAGRKLRGLPVLPYQPRMPVPWKAIDLAMAVVLYGAASAGVATVDEHLGISQRLARAAPSDVRRALDDDQSLSASHPLVILMSERRDAATLLFCLFVGAVVAPLAEEFFFRLLVQGWLESLEPRWRRQVPVLGRLARGTAAIVPASLLFAALHYRPGEPVTDPRQLYQMFWQLAAAELLAVAAVACWVRARTGATAVDFGLSGAKLWADVQLGLLAFLAAVALVYAVQIGLRALFGTSPWVDPASLFLFALVLGTLYYRTHRIVPPLVAHMALNSFSLVALWLGVNAGV